MKIELTEDVNHDNIPRKAGDVLEMPEKQAQQLVDSGSAKVPSADQASQGSAKEDQESAKTNETVDAAKEKAAKIVAAAQAKAAKIVEAAQADADRITADAKAAGNQPAEKPASTPDEAAKPAQAPKPVVTKPTDQKSTSEAK